MTWITVRYPKYDHDARRSPAPEIVDRFAGPEDSELASAVDRLVEEEANTCPRCSAGVRENVLPRFCPQCGAFRDVLWWQGMVQRARSMVEAEMFAELVEEG
jgi:ribosomal protein S27AE